MKLIIINNGTFSRDEELETVAGTINKDLQAALTQGPSAPPGFWSKRRHVWQAALKKAGEAKLS